MSSSQTVAKRRQLSAAILVANQSHGCRNNALAGRATGGHAACFVCSPRAAPVANSRLGKQFLVGSPALEDELAPLRLSSRWRLASCVGAHCERPSSNLIDRQQERPK